MERYMKEMMKRIGKRTAQADLCFLVIWAAGAAMLSCLICAAAELSADAAGILTCVIIALMFALPGILLYAVLRIVHRVRLRRALRDMPEQRFMPLGRDLALSDDYLVYCSSSPVIVRKRDVMEADVYEDRIVLTGAMRIPFSYLTDDAALVHALQEWAGCGWRCPVCGSRMESGFGFCSQCGAPRPVPVKGNSRRARKIITAAVIILLAAALILMLAGERKPIRQQEKLQPDGYLSAQCEQMMNPGTQTGDSVCSAFDITCGYVKL